MTREVSRGAGQPKSRRVWPVSHWRAAWCGTVRSTRSEEESWKGHRVKDGVGHGWVGGALAQAMSREPLRGAVPMCHSRPQSGHRHASGLSFCVTGLLLLLFCFGRG